VLIVFNPATFELIKRFDDLPNDAVLPTKATELVLGVSGRTVRYRLDLPRVQISAGRYGYRVGDIRDLVRRGRAHTSAAT
jgi:hypothetical protein